jgi:hypothetical protein
LIEVLFPLMTGKVLSEVAPAIATALYGGHITDKNQKRRLLLTTNTALLLLALAMLAATWPIPASSHSPHRFIYALLFASGFARAFYEPALFAVYSNSVPRDEYANAASWNNLSWQLASVTGPVIAGFAYAFAGRIHQNLRDSLLAGLRFVFHTKPLLYAMNLDLFSVFFGGVSALLPVYALDILKVGAEGLGVMRMVMAAGAALTMLAATRFSVMRRPWRNLLIAAGGFGVCIVGFGFSEDYALTLFFLFGQGAFDSISVLIRSTLLQLLTPEAMRGRVSAVNSMFIASSAEIGDFESGVAASLLGTIPAVLLGGCITLAVVLFTFSRTGKMVWLPLEQLE